MDWFIHTDFCTTRRPQRSNLVSLLHFHISVFVDQYKLGNLWVEYQELLSNFIMWPCKTLFDCFGKLGCDCFSIYCGCHGKRPTYVSFIYVTKYFVKNVCFSIRYLSVGVPICIYNFIKAITLFKAAHRIRMKEKLEREFKRHNYHHYNRQISIPHPDFNCHQDQQHHQKVDQFVNPQQYNIYPHYHTMNTANLAIHPYHQNTMQYTQPTLYSVSVPQSAEFY